MTKLTPKQQRFVDEYLVDLNATQAAIRAGYSAKTANEQGNRLLANVSVQKAIQEAMSARSERTKIDQDYVVNNLVEVVERCMQRAPVCNMRGQQIQDEDGNHLWTFNGKVAVAALGLLGKNIGMFVERKEIKADIDVKSGLGHFYGQTDS